MPNPRRWILSAVALVLFSLLSVQACSPGWTPDVFVRKYRPDVPREFYAGKLGVLENTYFRFNLVAAYRYLNGGKLAANEIIPDHRWDYIYEGDPDSNSYAWSRGTNGEDVPDDDGTGKWLAARNAAATSKTGSVGVVRPIPGAGSAFVDSFVNCTPDAFRTAAATLGARAKAWGKSSPLLVNWIAGQDAVFSNCTDATPQALPALPASPPLLLQQDRAYQRAAAAFYSMQFASARADFQAIREDKASPWKGIAALLVTRTLVREAMLNAPPSKTGDVSFDADLLRQALAQLQALAQDHDISTSAVLAERNYVESRIDPNARIRSAAKALAGPAPDTNFQQDLFDLVFLLDRRLDKDAYQINADAEPANAVAVQRYQDVADLLALHPMVDWMVTFQSRSDSARKHALERWETTLESPWLVAAISKAAPRDSATAKLLDAAAHVPVGSPAWQTVTYHRARLLAATDPERARMLLDATLARVKAAGPASALNAFTGLRMTVATSLPDFLTYVPRRDLVASGQYAADASGCKLCSKAIAEQQFDADSAGFFNTQAPLDVWLVAAQAPQLTVEMRQDIVLAGWTRAVVLNDEKATRAFAALLPASLRTQAGDTPGFQAWLTILRNPGLRIYLDAGVQRSQSAAALDQFEDNWWSAGWAQGKAPVGTSPASFLTAEQVSDAKQQLQALEAADSATAWLGPRVIGYAKVHTRSASEGEEIAEALHLLVRATRYGPSDSAVSAEAFRLLHRDYPGSQWTAKTPYHF